MKTYALIIAAGNGTRFNKTLDQLPKIFHKIGGRSVLEMVVEKFLQILPPQQIMIVVNQDYIPLYHQIFAKKNLLPPAIGGKERADSVKNGLEKLLPFQPDKVLIHDGARPFVTAELINLVIDALAQYSAVLPVLKLVDTIKYASGDYAEKTIDRAKLYRAQTPQGFDFAKLYSLYQKNTSILTDDSALFEQAGERVYMIEGEEKNIKITYSKDLPRPEFMFYAGFGYDVHKFDIEKNEDNNIMLGGIKIQHPYKIIAHSDGDILLHALVDALLGAAAKGDIGYYFPPSDNKYKNMDSSIFVAETLAMLEKDEIYIANVDCLVVCEKPAIGPHRFAIAESIAKMLKIDKNRVNIKATTTEGLGFTGRREGVACKVVVSLYTALI